MPTREELTMLQHLPLEVKVAKSQQRIREWVDFYGKDGVYVSFSGGKDSTVLLDLVRGLYGNDIPAVFCDTGLEYPEIKTFVKTFENVEIVKPKINFVEVIKKYGYPLVSKEVSHKIGGYRKKYKPNCFAGAFDRNSEYYKRYGERYCLEKWIPLRDSNIPISNKCCDVMKKSPMHIYSHKNKRVGILGTLAEESAFRQQKWLKNGCNAFNIKEPLSQPLSFWTNQDILQYIKQYNLPIASVYGDIVALDCSKNQYENDLTGTCKLKTTGCQRTGCIFCAFGAHHDTRFLELKITHPKQYNYCMNGGEFVDGIWKPNKEGLGMRYVFDRINEIYGKDFIKYE